MSDMHDVCTGSEVPSPDVGFESAGASALNNPLPFGFNPGDAMDDNLIDRGVLNTPRVVGLFIRSIGSQSTPVSNFSCL